MIQNKEEECSLKFQRLAERLCDMKWISAVRADFSKLQNKEFLKSGSRKYTIGLVHSLVYMTSFEKLRNFCKFIFTFWHGQTAVEKGYCVKKERVVENLQQKSYVEVYSEVCKKYIQFWRIFKNL